MKLKERTLEFWDTRRPGNQKSFYLIISVCIPVKTKVNKWVNGCRIVESVGEGVRDVESGDYVISVFHGECGECIFCKSENTNVCENFGVNPMKKVMVSDGKCRFWDKDGNPIFHFLNTSTFCEYTVLDSACVVKIQPKIMSLKHMALLSCCISTGLFFVFYIVFLLWKYNKNNYIISCFSPLPWCHWWLINRSKKLASKEILLRVLLLSVESLCSFK